MSEGPLSGLRVLEVGDFISAPYAGKLLADLGAEVIKIEDPMAPDSARDFGPFPGDVPSSERSGLYAYLNTNKLGATLNLRCSTGRALFLRLAASADAVLDGDPSRPLRGLGLGHQTLRGVNPSLVVTCVTPFGLTGPYACYKANDMVACHASGVSHRQIGYPDREPIRAAWYHADHWGAINAAAATLLALTARDRAPTCRGLSGCGQLADVSPIEALATMFVAYNNIGPYRDHGLLVNRTGYVWTGAYYGIFPCKDGYVFIFTPDDHMWEGFVEAMGRPEWTRDPLLATREGRAQHTQEVLDLILNWLKDQPKEEVFRRSQEHRAPNTAVYDVREVFENRHLRARRFFEPLPMPEGPAYEAPGAPYRFSEAGWRLHSAAPRLGQHNAEVYCQRLGVGPAELAALRRSQVI
jgi:crotonobetainyl-CoA:carnitine CoA-transferase CaiB-like acyl-CoA transferase